MLPKLPMIFTENLRELVSLDIIEQGHRCHFLELKKLLLFSGILRDCLSEKLHYTKQIDSVLKGQRKFHGILW